MLIKLKATKAVILLDILWLGIYLHGRAVEEYDDYTLYDFCLLYFGKDNLPRYIIKPTNRF